MNLTKNSVNGQPELIVENTAELGTVRDVLAGLAEDCGVECSLVGWLDKKRDLVDSGQEEFPIKIVGQKALFAAYPLMENGELGLAA